LGVILHQPGRELCLAVFQFKSDLVVHKSSYTVTYMDLAPNGARVVIWRLLLRG
jgi:hypothetical protein